MVRLALVLGLLLSTAGAARAAASAAELERVIIVGRAEAGAAWQDGPTEARRDDAPELAVVGVAREAGAGNKGRIVYLVDDDVAPLVIGGKAVPAKARRAWTSAGDVAVQWSTVEPHAWREGGAPGKNGATTPYYSNVVSGGERHGKWLGYDVPSYFETPIGVAASGAEARRRLASARPPRAEDDRYDGYGTMRYRVEVRLGERVWTTAGAEDVDGYGITPRVHRVSIRKDDTTLGWLAAYFLVPEIFGSAGPGANHQTERWIGADCADVLVGARRAAGGAAAKKAVAYTNVLGLVKVATVVAGVVELDASGAVVGGGAAPAGVKAGDIVRIDYAGGRSGETPRSWDHVALIWEDRSDPAGPAKGAADGVLDRWDLVVHMGHPRLVVEPLGEQLPARVDVLRWK